ncbi:MAG: nitronate monooxygenase [Vulcanimicrobiaceae bacterium]
MRTALTERLGIAYPLLNAPMTPQAGGALARAVGDAGAFGMLGFDESETPERIATELALLRDGNASVRFGIGLVRWVLDRRPELVDLAIAARPAFVSISFGDPAPYVARFHAAGILVGAQVQSRAWARAALDAGVDILIAQGTEAGGHTGSVGTLPLLQMVLDMAGDVPVVAAGGIATGRGLAAVLAAGAAGAWIGTPFLVASEARSDDIARDRVVRADETQTVLTAAFDRAQRKAWPAEFRGRALRNAFTDRYHEHEDEITPDARERYEAARARANYDVAHLYAGQTVGLVAGIEPAAAIVERIVREADARLAHVAAAFARERR